MTEDEARLYAMVHDGVPGDVAFYAAKCEGADSVLELGCGWGRVASALDHARVVGIESDRGMLALARERGFEAVDADMRDFSLGTFDRVIIPFTGIYCLLSEDDVVACLRCAREALAPGGRLIFDAYAADAFHASARPDDYSEDRLEEVTRFEHGGVEVVCYERSSWERETHRMDATYVFLGPDDAPVAEFTIGHRYILAEQVEPLLERAGLRLVALSGSFDGEPFDPHVSGSLVVEAACAEG